MWLLKFHCAVSILCMLAIFGFLWVFYEIIKANGWGVRVEGGPLKRCLICLRNMLALALLAFITVINVATPWVLLYMTSHENPKKEAA